MLQPAGRAYLWQPELDATQAPMLARIRVALARWIRRRALRVVRWTDRVEYPGWTSTDVRNFRGYLRANNAAGAIHPASWRQPAQDGRTGAR